VAGWQGNRWQVAGGRQQVVLTTGGNVAGKKHKSYCSGPTVSKRKQAVRLLGGPGPRAYNIFIDVLGDNLAKNTTSVLYRACTIPASLTHLVSER